jgi:GSH-dependent disulfide-bond oxidoreductase
MIDLYYWPTPNGWKVSILLEELSIPYKLIPVNIGQGDQFKPDFLKIAPNNRMPAIVDHDPLDGGEPISIFESAAIMTYLADKHDRFFPKDVRARTEANQWLFWQMGGLGPMAGQAHHFRLYAPEKIAYGIDRYTNEVNRLYGVMDRHLADRDYLAGEYSIADMACWPWVARHERQGQDLNDFPSLKRWYDDLQARPGLQKGHAVGAEHIPAANLKSDEARKVLFGQSAKK